MEGIPRMICPACKHDGSIVDGTMAYASVNLRRRKCKNCGYTWNTAEMPSDISVILEQAYKLTREDVDKGVLEANKTYRQHTYLQSVQDSELPRLADTADMDNIGLPEDI